MRYKFIREHRQEFSIKRMCQLLDVTRSGYYAWQPEKAGPRELENQVLVKQIHTEYRLSRKTKWSAHPGQPIATGCDLWTKSSGTLDAQRRNSPSKTATLASCDHPASARCNPSTQSSESGIFCRYREQEMGQ